MTVDHDKAADAVAALLDAIGAPPDVHLRDTPDRVAAAWADALRGYAEDPGEHLDRRFPAPNDPGVVIVAGIEVHSTCAHHLLPVRGTATVAYAPWQGDMIVGLSKLARVVDGYARRLQVQERIGADVVAALVSRLNPRAAGCVITADHGCMTERGVAMPHTLTTTAAWAGQWEDGQGGARDVLDEHRAHRRG